MKEGNKQDEQRKGVTGMGKKINKKIKGKKG